MNDNQQKRLLLLNGPNLNLLGTREPEVYGQQTLPQIERELHNQAQERVWLCRRCKVMRNTNWWMRCKGESDGVDFILINPGAFTHTSIALRDAFLGVGIPFIEVHLSNVTKGRSFCRCRFSVILPRGHCGLGAQGYPCFERSMPS